MRHPDRSSARIQHHQGTSVSPEGRDSGYVLTLRQSEALPHPGDTEDIQMQTSRTSTSRSSRRDQPYTMTPAELRYTNQNDPPENAYPTTSETPGHDPPPRGLKDIPGTDALPRTAIENIAWNIPG